MVLNTSIDFEVGDVVYCSYYNTVGVIDEIKRNVDIKDDVEASNAPWIKIKDEKGNTTVTKMSQKSANSPMTNHLTMVCKKQDVINAFISSATFAIKNRLAT